jgi:predicted transcriptional regulator
LPCDPFLASWTWVDRAVQSGGLPRTLLVTLAGWVNRHQQQIIEYLVEENRILKEQLKGRRVRLTDDQRRRLAAKGQRLGRRVLRQWRPS